MYIHIYTYISLSLHIYIYTHVCIYDVFIYPPPQTPSFAVRVVLRQVWQRFHGRLTQIT